MNINNFNTKLGRNDLRLPSLKGLYIHFLVLSQDTMVLGVSRRLLLYISLTTHVCGGETAKNIYVCVFCIHKEKLIDHV